MKRMTAFFGLVASISVLLSLVFNIFGISIHSKIISAIFSILNILFLGTYWLIYRDFITAFRKKYPESEGEELPEGLKYFQRGIKGFTVAIVAIILLFTYFIYKASGDLLIIMTNMIRDLDFNPLQAFLSIGILGLIIIFMFYAAFKFHGLNKVISKYTRIRRFRSGSKWYLVSMFTFPGMIAVMVAMGTLGIRLRNPEILKILAPVIIFGPILWGTLLFINAFWYALRIKKA